MSASKSGLKRISFAKPREFEPRLSAPRQPGGRHERFWTEAELDILRQHYPIGGLAACMALLPPHRASRPAIYVKARALGLSAGGRKAGNDRIDVSPEMDQRIAAEWAKLDARKKGEVAALADRLGVPRWWLSRRAAMLGLTIRYKKEPRWSAAEEALLARVPLHDPVRAARIFLEHGFRRTPTAIVVRAKRLDISRKSTRETLSAREAAEILGVDAKWITSRCIDGRLKAGRRGSQRLSQQGGDAWAIAPGDLRQFVVDHLEEIDIRKVEKFAFVALIAKTPAAAQSAGSHIATKEPTA